MEGRGLFPDALYDFYDQSRPVLRAAAVFVCPVVDQGRDQAAQKEEVGDVDLDAVKAGFFSAKGSVDELIPH